MLGQKPVVLWMVMVLTLLGYSSAIAEGGDELVLNTGYITVGLPAVTITANDPTATEAGATTGQFTVKRTGSTTAALTVKLAYTGTATPGSDYIALPGSVTIPKVCHGNHHSDSDRRYCV